MTDKNKIPSYKILNWEKWLNNAPGYYQTFFKQEEKTYNKLIKVNYLILDVGFGTGRLLNNLKLKNGCKIIGIDNDPHIFKKYAHLFQNKKNITVFYDDITKNNFKNKTFNLIILSGFAFGNFGKKKFQLIKEIKRLLRPNGIFVFSAYTKSSILLRMGAYNKDGLNHKILNNGTIIGTFNGKKILISESYNKTELKNIFNKYKGIMNIIFKNKFSYIVKVKFKK